MYVCMYVCMYAFYLPVMIYIHINKLNKTVKYVNSDNTATVTSFSLKKIAPSIFTQPSFLICSEKMEELLHINHIENLTKK